MDNKLEQDNLGRTPILVCTCAKTRVTICQTTCVEEAMKLRKKANLGEMVEGEMFSCSELKVSALQLSCDFSVSVDKPAYELILSYSRDAVFLFGFLLNPFLKKRFFPPAHVC